MMLVATKLMKMEKELAELLQQFQVIRDSYDQKIKKLDSAVQALTIKLDELGNAFDSVFTAEGEVFTPSDIGTKAVESVPTSVTDFYRDDDGSILASPTYKDQLLLEGYKIIGTVSKDDKLLLKMSLR